MPRLALFQTFKRNAAFFSLLSFTVFISYANLRFQEIDALREQSHLAPLFTGNTSSNSILSPTLLYRPNGLLEVNYDSRHPIYDLIDKAKADWEVKLARQSKTLREACLEYKRRYGREPPQGFDKWWAYVELHRVQLPDEYDFLHHNLEIFWGVAPSLLEKRRQEWAANSGTFTIGKGQPSGKVEITSIRAQQNGDVANVQWRAGLQLNVLKDIGKLLLPFNATFYSEDVPYQFFSYEAKDLARSAAQSKSVLKDIPSSPYLGWASACPPNSSLHTNNDWDNHPSPHQFHKARPKTFIHDYLTSMDPCMHWHFVHFVGYLSNHGKGPSASNDLLPSFAISSDPLHADILAVSPEGWTEEVGYDPVWEHKKDSRLFWRGSNTGAFYAEKNPWDISHRMRLMSQSTDDEDFYEVLSPTPPTSPVGKPRLVPAWKLNRRLLDVGFTNEPIQCEPKICACLRHKFDFGGFVSQDKANKYKYLLDIDGNAWSARFKRLMSTNSCVLKSTMFPEWYADRIQPWLHYVPVKVDLSDLYDILTFFRGEDDWTNSNDALAASIAKAGKDWSRTFYRREDMTAYMFRLFLEYARLMSPDRDHLSFTDY